MNFISYATLPSVNDWNTFKNSFVTLDILIAKPSCDLLGRRASHNRIPTNIRGHDCSGRDYRSAANGHPGHHNRSIPDPHIIFHRRHLRGSPRGIPYSSSNHIEAMIVTSDKRNVARDQYIAAKTDIAVNCAVWAKLDAVAELGNLVRSPNRNTPWNPHQPASFCIAAPSPKIDCGSQPVGDSSQRENQQRAIRASIRCQL